MAADPSADTEPTSARARGRELALLVLYFVEPYADDDLPSARQTLWSDPPVGEGAGEDALRRLCADAAARAFADELVDAWQARRTDIDRRIQETSTKWRLDRMDRVDRNAMRLGIAELLAMPSTPRGVVLSEAARLARRYGSEKSAPFVNGVLDAIARRIEAP